MNYEQAKANYERTKADYEAAVNAWEDSRLYAPFDGYVQQAHIERYQDVKPSVPVVTFYRPFTHQGRSLRARGYGVADAAKRFCGVCGPLQCTS